MELLIYDCEIIRCIPPKNRQECAPTLDYCKGWHDHSGMGISVIGFMSNTGSPKYSLTVDDFCPHTIDKTIVGFNSKNFDDKLLSANGLSIQTHYDLLEEVRVAAGFQPHWQSVPKGFKYNLGALGNANGFPKTGSGELAPILWQQGKHQEVIDYCLNDVWMTYELLMLGLSGFLVDPNTGRKLKLRPIEEVCRDK